MTKQGRKLNDDSRRVLQLLLDYKAMSYQDLAAINFKGEMPWDHRSVFLKMHDLQRRGYVKKQQTKNQSFFHLTPKGKLNILKYLRLEKLKIKKWDGHWRIAIFDVPEDRKKLRENFRHYLKYLGFQALQDLFFPVRRVDSFAPLFQLHLADPRSDAR